MIIQLLINFPEKNTERSSKHWYFFELFGKILLIAIYLHNVKQWF